MFYQEYRPARPLMPVIDCFWRAEVPDTQFERGFDLILPDACTDLLFNLSPYALQFQREGKVESITDYKLVGQRIQSLHILPSPHISLFGIRFKPHGLAAFTEVSQKEIRQEGCCPPSDILGSPAEGLAELALKKGCPTLRLPQIEGMLLRAMYSLPSSFPAIQQLMWEVLRARGKVQVQELCRHSGLHKSTIENYFRYHTGLRPKEYTRIIRFNHLLTLLRERSAEKNLTCLAYEAGYTDQSHMIREFRAFTGHTPSDFLKRNFRLSKVTETYIRNREKYYPFH